MRFECPQYLNWLWLLPFLLGYFIYVHKKGKKLLSSWADHQLLGKLVVELNYRRRWLKRGVFLLGMGLILFSLARPQWGYKLEQVKRYGIDIVVCLDASKSMMADDVKPSRLEYAKNQIKDLLKILDGDRIGLVIFAGTSFAQCPLTLDYGAFKLFLDMVTVNMIAQQGTDIGGAIKKAISMFGKGTRKHRAIILITDGEDHEERVDAAINIAKKEGIPIYTVGIGSVEGTPVPVFDEEGNRSYLKDRNGNIVLSKMDAVLLKKIALSTGGAYITPKVGLDRLYSEKISKIEKREVAEKQRKRYEHRYQIFLFLGFLLLMIEGVIRG